MSFVCQSQGQPGTADTITPSQECVQANKAIALHHDVKCSAWLTPSETHCTGQPCDLKVN